MGRNVKEKSSMPTFVLIYVESGNTKLKVFSFDSCEKTGVVGGGFELPYQEPILDNILGKVNFK